MRNMSFMLTTEQMYKKTKTVTRRMGWKFLKPGDIIQAVEKCQGLKKGEKIKKICLIRIISTKDERLDKLFENRAYGKSEVIKEGFPKMSGYEFVGMFKHFNRCDHYKMVNRIEFEFV